MQSKLRDKIKQIVIIPLIILGIISMTLICFQFISYNNMEIEKQMNSAASNTVFVLDQLYKGTYKAELNNGEEHLKKGDTQISDTTETLESLKTNTGYNYSIVYKNSRIATTIKDNDGYILGTPINAANWGMMENGIKSLTDKNKINNRTYNTYYIPIRENNTFVGVIEIAKETNNIYMAMIKVLAPIVIALIVLLAAVIIVITKYFLTIADHFNNINEFVQCIASEKYNKRISDTIYDRTDEIGEIGRNVTVIRNVLRDTMEKDATTDIYNKRTGSNRLKALENKCMSNNNPYCVAFANIDHFQTINQKYGVAAGDAVLKDIATMLKKKMKPYGIVARWENDEFMLGFENVNSSKANKVLNEIIKELHKVSIEYNGMVIDITMTFGLVENKEAKTLKDLITVASERLNFGKNNGRNQIVFE